VQVDRVGERRAYLGVVGHGDGIEVFLDRFEGGRNRKTGD
jgi:hypothetical protein